MIRSQQGNLLLGGGNFQLFGGDYCADKDLDKIYGFNERFYGVTSYEATTIMENACGSVAAWSGISCCGFAASRRTRHNILLGSTIVRDDDDGIDKSFDSGCS